MWDEIDLRVITRIAFYLSLGLLICSFFLKNKLPPKEEILPEVYLDPQQEETYQEPFEVTNRDGTYDIEPLYEYQLHGLVVSCHDTGAWWDYYHDKWGDSLNLKDICVIWGHNIKSEVYRRMKFKNGSFTCYVSVNARTAEVDWPKFSMGSLSNNHLLSGESDINQIVRKTEKGDQVFLKGYLARYSRKGSSFGRSSSTSRDDRGDGACETIYLTDYKILKKDKNVWKFLHTFSKFLTLGSLAFIIALRLKSPFG